MGLLLSDDRGTVNVTRGSFAPLRAVSAYCLTERGWLGAERDAADPAGDDREVEYNQGLATVEPRSGGTLTKELGLFALKRGVAVLR